MFARMKTFCQRNKTMSMSLTLEASGHETDGAHKTDKYPGICSRKNERERQSEQGLNERKGICSLSLDECSNRLNCCSSAFTLYVSIPSLSLSFLFCTHFLWNVQSKVPRKNIWRSWNLLWHMKVQWNCGGWNCQLPSSGDKKRRRRRRGEWKEVQGS